MCITVSNEQVKVKVFYQCPSWNTMYSVYWAIAPAQDFIMALQSSPSDMVFGNIGGAAKSTHG